MQNKLTEGTLLNKEGNLSEAGYALQLVKSYNRKDIKANSLRIKEWDYYYLGNDNFGIALTIADNSYMSLVSVSVLDFKNKTNDTKSIMGAFSKGKLKLPSTSVIGDVIYEKKNIIMKFYNDGKERHLVCYMKNLAKNKDFNIDVTLVPTIKDSLVIATPFFKDKHFYYNQKINCLKAQGIAKFGDTTYNLNNCYGVLDWGRGVWTYKNTWYWSSMSGILNGKPIGFNLGYGFGDTSRASENIFFYGEKTYKLDDISFNIPIDEKHQEKYLDEWTFTSSNEKINLKFKPVLNRYSGSNVLIIKSIQNQVFGYFSGSIDTEDGIIEFNNILGFAEKVINHW